MYEEEEHVFGLDFGSMTDAERLGRWDNNVDNIIALRNLPNVLITPHQAFLTNEALEEIGASVGRSVVGPVRDATCQPCLTSPTDGPTDGLHLHPPLTVTVTVNRWLDSTGGTLPTGRSPFSTCVSRCQPGTRICQTQPASDDH